MFVTSGGCDGALTCSTAVAGEGVEAANAFCQALATAAGLVVVDEEFRAWLSDDATDAYCNVLGLAGARSAVPACGAVTLPAAGPWVRIDGIPFAESIDALVDLDGGPLVPKATDENGVALSYFGPNVQTASDTQGVFDGTGNGSCANWTDNLSGNANGSTLDVVNYEWASGATVLCSSPDNKLVCFEVGAGDPLVYPSEPGALVFVSSSISNGDLGGLAGADATCQALAAAAFLPFPGEFVAWLSDSTIDASARLTISGPWERVDGIRIAASLADLTDGTVATALYLDESGLRHGFGVWTGTDPDGTLGASTCLDWEDGATEQGTNGRVWRAGNGWTSVGPTTCSVEQRIYCFSNRLLLGWDSFESGTFERWPEVVGGP
jgi:hypothetical protein